ncbi:2OG-Fe(II) oxygenase [Shewanella yunxiaonensis]|uniref:2OG-Fe(II) oxygenase n=1 Tax=Shewanella yunxiaonensis TaxID=2829809 RepID=A0ABX7YWF1_9GAMM|nr:2OG-Fe(II) oxygenase [Shewanella yunxiaonensis]QUN07142.1 2OG-Fe(II) oxygenase [Shewanella yunxiaonensis]
MTDMSGEAFFDLVADALQDAGYIVLPQIVAPMLIGLLRQSLAEQQGPNFRDAAIGRGGQQQLNQTVRSDRIRWLTADNQPDQQWLSLMDQLRIGLNRRLFMGLFDYESHYAWYRPGAFYRKHVDALPGSRNRILTTVLFLNENWQSDEGGELQLFDEQDQLLQQITPEAGTLVIFLSERFPHEVLPTRRGRGSIAGWFRVSNSHYGF